ncbi:MAG: ComEC/Rec2 family competence protein [Alistipes sp.]|jgi:competence protein ComEC|nr:ComEC/Rec2 family competence protein [Alistipes sp.]
MSAALTLSEKLRTLPMLRVLVPMVAGIACGSLVAVPIHVCVVVTVVCGVTAGLAIRRRTAFLTLYVCLTILFFGATLARIHTPRPVVPQGGRVWMEIVLTDTPIVREGQRGAATSGTVTRWHPDETTPAEIGWHLARERLLVTIDTMWSLGAGDRVTFRGYVNPVSDTVDSYSRLMRARGYTGRTYITQYSHPAVAPERARSLALWAKNLQIAATERLRRLSGNAHGGSFIGPEGYGANAIAVAAAMTTGDRSGITPAMRRSYSRTGASHLLAVSGLHVGIVFMIVNALLWLLPLVRGGHIVGNVLAVVAIWFYAALTGGSPSVVRAAFMFSGAQVALATSQTRGPANIMCGTAVVMLAVRPGLLFDISFQLSFVAVAAIMAWFRPLYSLVASRWRLLNVVWGSLLVGFVASVATMPLVSHTFGVFSPAGLVLNPVVILTAYLTVGFSLLWIVVPAGFLAPVFRWLAGGSAWLQNRVVEMVGSVPGAAVEWTMPLWMVFAVYAAMIIFTAWLGARSTCKTAGPFILPR